MTADVQTTPTCEECGASADVHVSNLADGVPTMRHYCATCVEATALHYVSRRRRAGDAAVVIVVGAIVLLMSLFADPLRFGPRDGFGHRQVEGTVAGCILLLLGAVARARTLVMIGLIAVGLALLADWLEFGSAEGFGWQQMFGTALGVAIIAGGVWMARRKA